MKSKKKKTFLQKIAMLVLTATVIFVVMTIGLFVYASKNVNYEADEALFASVNGDNSVKLYVDGNFYDEVYTPMLSEEICFSETKKSWADFEEISSTVKAAFLAAEDRDFYSHKGINVKRTAYAALNYVTKKQSIFGASTITQQVIKNISGDDEVTLKRKLNEILRALHTEHEHTKDEIFEVYLNIIPLSENVAGVAGGSYTYFDKDVAELSVTEAATLAAITNAPTKYNPYLHPDACLNKRNKVLFAMMDAGFLTMEEYEYYSEQPLGVVARKSSQVQPYSWFAETVFDDVIFFLTEERRMSEKTAKQVLAKGGLSIYTTMQPTVQTVLENRLEDVSKLPSSCKSGLQCAMCVVNPYNGHLLGIVGQSGIKSGNRLSNYATIPQTPGSAHKPLALYAPLLDSGMINAATVFDDVPVIFNGSNPYPQNSPKIYAGLTTVSDAVRLSKNTVATRLYEMRGAERIYADLKNDFGIDTLIRKQTNENGDVLTDLAMAPMALGQLTSGVGLRKLTEAYAVFPDDGVLHPSCSFVAIYDADGETLYSHTEAGKRVYKESTARIMNQMLSGVVKSGTAKSISLKNKVAIAGKTGTSGDDRDRLFIGYTSNCVCGIWCGYPESKKSNWKGCTVAP